MNHIGWPELLSAGSEDLDVEHKTLVSLINECVELSRAGDKDDRIVPAVVRLIVFTDQHFANEERIMKQFGCPDTDEHIAAHKQAIQQLYHFGINASGVPLCRSIASFLTNWFFAHATTHDKRFGEWLSRECPPSHQWPISSWQKISQY